VREDEAAMLEYYFGGVSTTILRVLLLEGQIESPQGNYHHGKKQSQQVLWSILRCHLFPLVAVFP